jgi:DNA-binding beta-propeller fold protein YncE
LCNIANFTAFTSQSRIPEIEQNLILIIMNIQLRKALVVLSLFSILHMISCKKDNNAPARAINLYYTAYNDNTVNKIDLINTPNAVTGLYTNTDGILTPLGITLTRDGYLIVAEESANKIVKMKKDGSGGILVLYDATKGVSSPTAITIDNNTGAIYWCNSGSGQVYKGSADGAATPVILFGGQSVLEDAYGIAIDTKNNKIYISDFVQFIEEGKLDGSGSVDTLWDNNKYSSMQSPSSICIDPDHNKIYWCDENANAVVAANLDGTGTPSVLFDHSDGVSRADGVFIDYASGKIYWSETTGDVIARGNLDGTGQREVLVNNVKPYAIVPEIR